MTRSSAQQAVRAAEFRDVHAIYAVIKEHPREVLPRSISDIVQNIDRFLVYEVRGRVAGVASWQILPEIGRALDPSIEIKSVAVSRRFQKRGLGTALVYAALAKVKRLRPAQVVVLTFTPDFFRRFGFREVPKDRLMHKLYMGCINCTKYDSPFTCPEVAMALAMRPGQEPARPGTRQARR